MTNYSNEFVKRLREKPSLKKKVTTGTEVTNVKTRPDTAAPTAAPTAVTTGPVRLPAMGATAPMTFLATPAY